MTKVDDKEEQARAMDHPSRWSIIKKWILHHKIETTAVVVCLIGAAVILSLVFAGGGDATPAPTGSPQTGDDTSSTTNNGVDAPKDPEDGDDTAPPPAPDTDIVLDSAIFQKLSLLTDLQDVNSPQYNAADWLIALDFLKLSANAKNLQQRFALATFYLSTGGGIASKQGWTRCSAVPPSSQSSTTEAASGMQCVVRDGKIICAEKENFELCDYSDEYGEIYQGKRFLSPVNECEWFGITCDDTGVVIKIDVENNELVGSLPPELSLLTGLARLNLSNNIIGGSLPKELSLIDGFSELLLTKNQLEGPIPVDFYDLSELKLLEVEHNTLSGSLLPEIGNWQSLEVMYLNHNKFSGELPSEMGEMATVRKATLHQNNFSGVIPAELGNLDNLQSIKFANNDLTGTMPSGLCGIPISADCLLNEDTGVTEVTCSCCTRCCADGKRCQDW